MVNIVTLSSRRYLVDVGMGARGPMVLLEMVSGASATSISRRTIRLLHGCIPEHTSSHPSNALWKLEMRNSEGSACVPTYAFTDMEFLPQDFEVMNWYVSMNPRS
jgi:arylamine N-acetyltransferase